MGAAAKIFAVKGDERGRSAAVAEPKFFDGAQQGREHHRRHMRGR